MPECVVRIADRGDADGMNRIRDVEQNSVAGARTSRKADRRIDSDVVALVRHRRGLRSLPMSTAFPKAIEGSGL